MVSEEEAGIVVFGILIAAAHYFELSVWFGQEVQKEKTLVPGKIA